MTSKSRIKKLLSWDFIDPPAVSLWRHFYHREGTAKDLASAMVDWQRKWSWDFVKVNPRASYHVEGWGAKFAFSTEELKKPVQTLVPVHGPEDLLRLKPLSPNEGALGEQMASLRLIREALGKDIFMVETVFTPLSIVADLCENDEAFGKLLHSAKKAVKLALEVVTETFKRFGRECLDAGADGVFFATTEWGRRKNITEGEYREFGKPFDLEVLEGVKGADFNILHVCKTENLLNSLLDYPVQALSWDPTEPTNPRLKEVGSKTDKVLIGGLNFRKTLLGPSPEAVRKEADAALSATRGKGFILAAGCTIYPETPEENIRAAEAVRHKSS
jgi:uroporphyrinogen decarboxylase